MPTHAGGADGSIYDGPLPGAFDAIKQLQERYAVFVFTTRDSEVVANWLADRGITVITDAGAGFPQFWNERDCVLVGDRKLPALAYIDDRGIRFESWEQALADLARYES
jgi:hypothetical protein